jgi:competence protein ComEC
VRVPAALVALPLIIGSCTGLLLFEHGPDHLPLYASGAALIALIGGLAALADDTPLECTLCIVAGALLAGLSLGTVAAARAYEPPLLEWFTSVGLDRSSPVEVRGVLREDATLTPTGVSLTIDVREVGEVGEFAVTHNPAFGGVRLSVAGSLASGRMAQWRAGRVVRVSATLREPVTYQNPGVPDERRALARRGIVLVGSVKSAALVDIVASGSFVSEWAAACRAWVRVALEETVGHWSTRSSGVARAILIGDRSGLAQDDERRLQEAGTYHVIAISGGNIAILTVMLVTVLRGLRVPSRISAGAAIVILIFYGRVTGPAPSIDRAITAAVIFLGARLLDHRGPPANVLAVATIIGLADLPTAALDPGFILSFGATLGILIGAQRIAGSMVRSSGPRRRASESFARRRGARDSGLARRPNSRSAASASAAAAIGLLAATAAAEIVLAPISAALFSRVTVAGLLLNFAAIPMMTIVQAGSMATLVAWPMHPPLALAIGYGVHLACSGLIDSARLLDLAPWLAWYVAAPAWWLLAAYYVALITGVCRIRCSHGALLAAAATGVVIVTGPGVTARDRVDPPATHSLRVVFLDVGQGDATLVVMPGGRAVLVDAGGLPAAPLQDPADGPAFDIGDRVVTPALRALGVWRLDTFVLTHADPDHIGGAPGVLRSFPPRAVWEGVPVPPHEALKALVTTANRLGAEWHTLQAGDRVRMADVDIVTLHPPLPDWERQRVRNDDSVVLDVRFGNVSIVLPGDVGREGEARAVRHLEPSSILLLKAPHHGSATSSTPEFLAAARPAAVIFSAGRANRFGHPAPVVVERYRALGATMFSTAEDGAVIVDTDGRTMQIRGWGSGRRVSLSR